VEHVTQRCSESVKAEHFIIFLKLQIQNFQIKIENHILSNSPITSEILNEILDKLDKSMNQRMFEYKKKKAKLLRFESQLINENM